MVCISAVCIPELLEVARGRKHVCGRWVVVEAVHSDLEATGDHNYRMTNCRHSMGGSKSWVVPVLVSNIPSLYKLAIVAWSGGATWLNFAATER